MAFAESVFARDDTLLGTCQALAEDFGFNPLFLRILFALALFWSPAAACAAYAGLGAVVALSRWIAPNPPQRAATQAAAEEHPSPDRHEDLPLAA